MARQIIAIRMAPSGTKLEHIDHLWWITKDGKGKPGDGSRAELVAWIKEGGKAYVKGADGTEAFLEVDETAKGVKYVRSEPDDSKLDNLLALPRKK